MKRPSRSKKRYKNDDDRPYFKRGEPVEVTQDFIRNVGDPDFPRYGWIVKKSRPLMSDPGYEYLIVRDPEFAADDGYDETYWVNNDQIKGGDFRYNESRLVKEGAGAGYDVGISELKIDKVTEVKKLEDGDYAFTATITPGFYEISAESYYDDFFWQEHEWGDKPEAKIDGGVIHGTICPWEDTDDPERWVSYQVQGSTLNISFMYGGGWMHSNLPEDGQLYIDKHIEINPEPYFSVDDIQLDAIDLVQAVNAGYASLDDRYNDEGEDEDGEPVNEVSGWKLEDEDLTLVNTESDGDKLYIVKLWWGSGYMTDNYNAYAFNEEEALNYVVAYIDKTDPESLNAVDENAESYKRELVSDGEASDEMEAEENPYFQEMFLYVDATTEGASQPHYIYAENLAIAEYPKEHDYPLAKGVDRSRFNENSKDISLKREVFTIEVSYVDENGDNQMIEAMKYAKTYYTYEEALTAAKEAYLEYAEICEEPVEVMVMGGEYEMPSGDIYGEPDVIEVITADTIDSLVV